MLALFDPQTGRLLFAVKIEVTRRCSCPPSGGRRRVVGRRGHRGRARKISRPEGRDDRPGRSWALCRLLLLLAAPVHRHRELGADRRVGGRALNHLTAARGLSPLQLVWQLFLVVLIGQAPLAVVLAVSGASPMVIGSIPGACSGAIQAVWGLLSLALAAGRVREEWLEPFGPCPPTGGFVVVVAFAMILPACACRRGDARKDEQLQETRVDDAAGSSCGRWPPPTRFCVACGGGPARGIRGLVVDAVRAVIDRLGGDPGGGTGGGEGLAVGRTP